MCLNIRIRGENTIPYEALAKRDIKLFCYIFFVFHPIKKQQRILWVCVGLHVIMILKEFCFTDVGGECSCITYAIIFFFFFFFSLCLLLFSRCQASDRPQIQS